MLTLRTFRTAATVLAFSALAACSKKEEPTPTPAPVTQGMSWTVDGANVTATSALGQALAGSTTLLVAGATGNTGGVFLDVPKTVGTYPLTSTSDAGASLLVNGSGSTQSFDSTSGTLVVTSVTANNVVGTFTFTGSNGTATKTVTNGKFNANY